MKIILSSVSEMQFSLNAIQNEKALHSRKDTKPRIKIGHLSNNIVTEYSQYQI